MLGNNAYLMDIQPDNPLQISNNPPRLLPMLSETPGSVVATRCRWVQSSLRAPCSTPVPTNESPLGDPDPALVGGGVSAGKHVVSTPPGRGNKGRSRYQGEPQTGRYLACL